MRPTPRGTVCALLLGLAACEAPPRADVREVELVLEVVP
jgi:hypothetical protein